MKCLLVPVPLVNWNLFEGAVFIYSALAVCLWFCAKQTSRRVVLLLRGVKFLSDVSKVLQKKLVLLQGVQHLHVLLSEF